MRGTALFALAFLATAVRAAAFPAFVQSCYDGDTCLVTDGQHEARIRLAEIDAPEIDRPYGHQSQMALCGIICGRYVDIEPRGRSYDRVVGLIRLNGDDISRQMVSQGAAWDYARYDRDTLMPVLQEASRRQGRGL